MTPWLRTLRTCGTLLTLAATTLAASPHGTTPPYDAPYVARPAPDASRAGSLAGEGRERPGRRESAPPDEAGDEEAVPVPEPTSAPEDERGDTGAQPGTVSGPVSGPVLRLLPLGSGLVLIGLGLGVAFVALRLRVRRT